MSSFNGKLSSSEIKDSIEIMRDFIIKALYYNGDFQDFIIYHFRLDYELSLQNSLALNDCFKKKVKNLVEQIKFDTKYIISHSKDEYLALGDIVEQKIEKGNYQISDGKMIILL